MGMATVAVWTPQGPAAQPLLLFGAAPPTTRVWGTHTAAGGLHLSPAVFGGTCLGLRQKLQTLVILFQKLELVPNN